MAHLSLYRKFRPDTFDKMVRQEHVVRILKNQIEGNSVGHAYLFCGPRGTGKTSVARIFSRAVNCETPVNGSPCGKCATCIALQNSLDIVEIDAASNNGVNEMRDLREKVQYPPVSGKYKVFIVDEVHMLTDSAFNALLKTLEEPPRHAIFILATTEPHKIPATILSRCMRLDFKLIPEQDLAAHLTGILEEMGKEYEKEAVFAIARAGAGSDRDMLSIAEMCLAYAPKLTYEGVTAVLGAADFTQTIALVKSLLACDTGDALSKCEQILAEGKAVGVLCRDLLQTLNQVALAKTCRNAEGLLSLPKELFEQVKEIALSAEGRTILRATEIFSKLENELRFASSPRISLETAVVRVSTPSVDEDIDALLTRISVLEKKLESGVASGAQQEAKPVVKEIEVFVEEPPLMEEPVYEVAPLVAEPVKEEKPAPAPKAVAVGEMTADVAFGRFLRTLRKNIRNGVLFTMCADLEPRFEGQVLVLETDIDMIVQSLKKEEHRALMQETFESVGVAEFEIRKKNKQDKDVQGGVEALKRDFADYPVEIK